MIAMARARDNSQDQNLSSAQRIVNVFHRQQMKSIEAFFWMFIWKVSQKSGCQNFHLYAARVNNFGKLKPDAIMGALFASALHGRVQAQSAVTPDSLTTLPKRTVSVLIRLPN